MRNKKITLFISVLSLAVVLLICSCIGAANISYLDAGKIILSKISIFNIDVSDIPSSSESIIWNIRFPRVLVGAVVGGALSVSGVAYQGLLKNPMADPYVIGVSSGAALGASIGIVGGISFKFLGLSSISVMALISAVFVVLIVYRISKVGKKVPMTTLLLSGLAIGQFLTAVTSLLMIFSERDMNRIIMWTMGSLSGKGWDQFTMMTPYVLVGILIIYAYSKDLNVFLLGDDTANNLGIDAEKVKRRLLIVSSLVTALAVSVSGIIGFVGLIIPHITRLIFGPDHRTLIPMSFIFGAALMVICDTLARSLISRELPVGIITAILGGPFFVYLLKKNKKEYL